MAPDTLSSNVVNYLVWRYLQESGFGSAAVQLMNCWNREPESLPFAKRVAPRMLVNILQDGVWFDKLQADVRHIQRQYDFGPDHGLPYVHNGTLLTLDEGRPAHELAEEAMANGAVQEPPVRGKSGPKSRKKTKANGIETRMNHHQVNGDVMDIDQNGNGNTHVTNSVRDDSEVVVSEVESPTVEDIPISTLSIGKSSEIQTEKTIDLVPSTAFASFKSPDGGLEQTLWSYSQPLLLAGGKSMMHLILPSKADSETIALQPQILDIPLPPGNFEVTAMCWNRNGDITASAVEELSSPDPDAMTSNTLFIMNSDQNEYTQISSIAGFVTYLQWNLTDTLLLSISTDGAQGVLSLWQRQGAGVNPVSVGRVETDNSILDGVWVSDTQFAVCGKEIFHVYEVTDKGVTRQQALDTRITWEKIRSDRASGIITAIGTDDENTGHLGVLRSSEPAQLHTTQYPDPFLTDLDTDLDIRPLSKYIPLSTSALLATCSGSGSVRIWDASEQSLQCIKRLPAVDDSPVFKTSFSPDGSLLAAAGPHALTIWDIEKSEVPIATWKAQECGNEKWDLNTQGFFSLGWDSDGMRLSIAYGDEIQIALIYLPPR
ncbi:hypothetical protein P154DRAFT_547259 [Amniculicola lignicola CBS 123094]|uniref:Uncharacterized protein n=1 Tax=Amniculicola lignicola CBS 123094 TaxID=1392246 RepID=A0A6A5W727_9PLEO|nr:hypothetical protein P154DRAFT_547259 [Amniculicola lignicola CBS 123094]